MQNTLVFPQNVTKNLTVSNKGDLATHYRMRAQRVIIMVEG